MPGGMRPPGGIPRVGEQGAARPHIISGGSLASLAAWASRHDLGSFPPALRASHPQRERGGSQSNIPLLANEALRQGWSWRTCLYHLCSQVSKQKSWALGPGTGLVSLVSLAQTHYSVNDIPVTCSVLTSFRLLVKAQAGKSIQPDLATNLISDDATIQAALSCPY